MCRVVGYKLSNSNREMNGLYTPHDILSTDRCIHGPVPDDSHRCGDKRLNLHISGTIIFHFAVVRPLPVRDKHKAISC